MDMPIPAKDISLMELRKIHRELVRDQGCAVTVVFMCDKKQLRSAKDLPNCTPREMWTDRFAWTRNAKDAASCENYIFRPHSL